MHTDSPCEAAKQSSCTGATMRCGHGWLAELLKAPADHGVLRTGC